MSAPYRVEPGMRSKNVIRLALCALLALVVSRPLFAADVKVWQEDLLIPTYPLSAPSPLPDYPEYRDERPFYPYAARDDFGGAQKTNQVWHALFLENEYLKVTVLPDLGGKLYSIFDKVTQREVLYRNHVVKYSAIGIRGAWTSGGIEWNFPDGHTPTAVSPVDFTTHQDKDGSAEITVGDTERVQGMQWMVTIRLRPVVRSVEVEIVLRNPQNLPGRYWFWANAAVPARDDLRFVYPMRLVLLHKPGVVQTYPVYNGVDYSYWRNIVPKTSLFALDSLRNFFGAYYERADNGVVQVADHRQLPGKKIWSWGTGKSAEADIRGLTDTDGPYAEIQAGRPIHQSEHLAMPPHHSERIAEYWYPVERLGGAWNEANRDAVLRLTVSQGKAHVWVEANRAFDPAEIALQDGSGKVLQSWKTALYPAVPFAAISDVAGNGPFVVVAKTAEGSQIIRYRSDQPTDGNERFTGIPAAEKAVAGIASAEQAYEEGQKLDNESHDAEAREKWETALRLNPRYAPAHLSLGISLYRTGEYRMAESHLREALAIAPDMEGARYYLGLLLRDTAPTKTEARALLMQAATRPDWADSSRIAVGEMALAEGAWKTAIEQLSLPTDFRARVLLALAYRASGNAARARIVLSQVRKDLPLDDFALSEAAIGGDREADAELWRSFDRRPERVLYLALSYAAVKSPEARKLLERAIARSQSATDPMWHYALGWLLETAGDNAGAIAQYTLGARSGQPRIFPRTVVEIEILNHALAALPANSPETGRTACYLGEALAGQHRVREAQEKWRLAVAANPKDAMPHYLLGYFAQAAKDSATAQAEYDKAVAADPAEYRFYLLRDDLLAADAKSEPRRLALFDAAPAAVKQHWQVAMRLVPVYAKAGRVQAAEELLRQIRLSDSAESVEWRRKSELAIADAYLKSGHGAEAAAALIRSTARGGDANPGDVPPKMCLEIAAALERSGKRDEAMQWVTRAAEWPANSKVVPAPSLSLPSLSLEEEFSQAMALARLRRFPAAKAAMEHVMKNDPAGDLGHEAEVTLRHWKAAGVIQ
jgi:tetratricopeptide (TPR) repeat protein